MACGQEIENPNFTVIENCTKCKSVYIVEVGGDTRKEIQETVAVYCVFFLPGV
jgi:hypothetical protein